MKGTELNLAERRTIEDLLHRKTKVAEIARQINRHRATVYREIKRKRCIEGPKQLFQCLPIRIRLSNKRTAAAL